MQAPRDSNTSTAEMKAEEPATASVLASAAPTARGRGWLWQEGSASASLARGAGRTGAGRENEDVDSSIALRSLDESVINRLALLHQCEVSVSNEESQLHDERC